ncbi:hypothetical protein Dda_6960 [Drechslerella dactyloides]|uniref:Uncharacterized protein n=1 Tax=Drechslerella dactyloides TaxID=74499 RepID=A0AAD6ISW3_DREDA|nr:hypothetical protein Dda_6960 [Drechslerella dactyloides]
MPEGITAYDMRRMLIARFTETSVYIEIHKRWFKRSAKRSAKSTEDCEEDDCKEGSGDTMNDETLHLLQPLLGQALEFDIKQLAYHGKQLGLSLVPGIWVRVKFALHGHCVTMTRDQYDEIKVDWDRTTPKFNICIQFALVGVNQVMVFSDHTKWIKFTAVPVDPENLRRVPSTSTAIKAFEVSDGLTKWTNLLLQSLRVPVDTGSRRSLQERVLRSGRAEPVLVMIESKEVPHQRRLPVYRVKWPKSGSGGNRFSYAYTVIEVFPMQSDSAVKLDDSDWKSLDWRNNQGEIGVANFMNSIHARKRRETGNKGRRVNLIDENAAAGKSTRQRGRPPKGRKAADEPRADPNRKRLKRAAEKERMRTFNKKKKLQKQEAKLQADTTQGEDSLEQGDKAARSLQAMSLWEYELGYSEEEDEEQSGEVEQTLEEIMVEWQFEDDDEGLDDEGLDDEGLDEGLDTE